MKRFIDAWYRGIDQGDIIRELIGALSNKECIIIAIMGFLLLFEGTRIRSVQLIVVSIGVMGVLPIKAFRSKNKTRAEE